MGHGTQIGPSSGPEGILFALDVELVFTLRDFTGSTHSIVRSLSAKMRGKVLKIRDSVKPLFLSHTPPCPISTPGCRGLQTAQATREAYWFSRTATCSRSDRVKISSSQARCTREPSARFEH